MNRRELTDAAVPTRGRRGLVRPRSRPRRRFGRGLRDRPTAVGIAPKVIQKKARRFRTTSALYCGCNKPHRGRKGAGPAPLDRLGTAGASGGPLRTHRARRAAWRPDRSRPGPPRRAASAPARLAATQDETKVEMKPKTRREGRGAARDSVLCVQRPSAGRRAFISEIRSRKADEGIAPPAAPPCAAPPEECVSRPTAAEARRRDVARRPSWNVRIASRAPPACRRSFIHSMRVRCAPARREALRPRGGRGQNH